MKMIDVSDKSITTREAVVTGEVIMKPVVVSAIRKGNILKGNVLEAAKIAGILAAKKTPDIVPLCHPIPIEYVYIEFSLKKDRVLIIASVKGAARTGVEMEAFTAVSVAALTVYDMCKSRDRGIIIGNICLLKKSGGKSGVYERK